MDAADAASDVMQSVPNLDCFVKVYREEAGVLQANRAMLTRSMQSAPKRCATSPVASESGRCKRRGRARTGSSIQQDKGVSSQGGTDTDDQKQESSEVTPGGLSLYELKRLENIRRNQAFLSSINLAQAAVNLKQKHPDKVLRRNKPRNAENEPLPTRKSARLQMKKEKSAAPACAEPSSRAAQQEHVNVPWKPEGPLTMEAVGLDARLGIPTPLLELWTEPTSMTMQEKLDLNKYKKALETMKLTSAQVAKVVKTRIISATFHPTTRRLLMTAGDWQGHVGLWDMHGQWDKHSTLLFQPHSHPVCSVAFSTCHPFDLFSASYDGTVRSTDLERRVFDEVYRADDSLSSFDFLSDDNSSILVSQRSGSVAIVDRRTPGTSHETLAELDPKALRCIHVHPLHRQYFVAAGSRDVHIYDVRVLRKHSSPAACWLLGHWRSVTCAYFSPSTGSRVLTTCMDNTIRVFDVAELTRNAPLLSSVRHNVQTGRWLTKLRAVWDPKQPDCFGVASLQRPRSLLVLHESGRLVHTFRDAEALSSVCPVVAFHPHRSALLGGSSSGRLHVFTD